LKIAVFEDVVTSGGSMLKAIDRIIDGGFIVTRCFALVDRLEGGSEAIKARGFDLHALFTRADFP